MSWYRQELQMCMGLMSDCFWVQAYITVLDMELNMFSEARPIVFPANKVLGFIDTKMFCQSVVMLLTDLLYLDGF